jgi:NAD(P)-dependent dehydrogenase (short-subunit alcohol dehydrogenase family)
MNTDDLFDVKSRICIVTGASSGLGAHMAGALAARGAIVWNISRSAPENGSANGVRHIKADVTDHGRMSDVLAQIEAESGPVSVLINNAGMSSRAGAKAIDPDEMQAVFDVNLHAPVMLADMVARRMAHAEIPGSIIHVSSVVVRAGMNRLAPYGASKAALDYMARQQALAWGKHGIRVNVIAPGWFRTDMTAALFERGGEAFLKPNTALRRLGDASDLTGTVVFLCSDASSFVTGAVIAVDGGYGL